MIPIKKKLTTYSRGTNSMDNYLITFYDIGTNTFKTDVVETTSFEDALEYARRIQAKEQILTEIKIQEE